MTTPKLPSPRFEQHPSGRPALVLDAPSITILLTDTQLKQLHDELGAFVKEVWTPLPDLPTPSRRVEVMYADGTTHTADADSFTWPGDYMYSHYTKKAWRYVD